GEVGHTLPRAVATGVVLNSASSLAHLHRKPRAQIGANSLYRGYGNRRRSRRFESQCSARREDQRSTDEEAGAQLLVQEDCSEQRRNKGDSERQHGTPLKTRPLVSTSEQELTKESEN